MATPSSGPVVSLTDVFKTYKVGEVDLPAVKGVTFTIPRRRFSVIVGPSGSGKTTLLNLIGGLDRPDAGTVQVDGTEVTALDEQGLSRLRRDSISYVFQTAQAALTANLVDELFTMLRALKGEHFGYRVDRYEHSLQSATRALRDGRSEEYVVAALLHDLGDELAPWTHGEMAAAIAHEENLYSPWAHIRQKTPAIR